MTAKGEDWCDQLAAIVLQAFSEHSENKLTSHPESSSFSAMPTYTWTAKDKSGARVLREIEALDAKDSRAALMAEGFTELALQEEDIVAQGNLAAGKAEFLGEEIMLTAKDRLQFRNRSLGSILLQSFAKDVPFLGVLGGLFAYCVYRNLLLGKVICAVLLIGWPIVRIGFSLQLILFRRLADAGTWDRNDEILQLVNQIRFVNRYHFVKVPDLELSRFEAHALAKLGRLSDAVLLYSRLENKPGLPSWLFKCHLASIYDSGRDHDTALKLSNEAITLKPDSILYVDHANRLARYFQDPAGARAALQHVDMDLLVDLSKPYVIRLRGIVAWLEDDFANARRDLEAAIEGMEKTCHIPGRAGNIAVAKGYLCCVCAELGDMETARKCWKEARVYLLATKETKLISDCEAALSLG